MKTVPRPKLEQQPFHKGVVPNFDEDRQIDSRNTQNRRLDSLSETFTAKTEGTIESANSKTRTV